MRLAVSFAAMVLCANLSLADTASHLAAAKKVTELSLAVDKRRLLDALLASLGLKESAETKEIVLEAFGSSEVEYIYVRSLMKVYSESELIGIAEMMDTPAYRVYNERMPDFSAVLAPQITAYWYRSNVELQRRQQAKRTQVAAQEATTAIQQTEGPAGTGRVSKDCAECPEMIDVPAGNFDMGVTGSPRRVALKRFALGKTEVTQRQWRAVMGNNPSHFSKCGDDCPVEKVSWEEAQEYVKKLSQKTGKIFRLPSEAEWEYACRAGGRHQYCGSDILDAVGWYRGSAEWPGNSEATTNPVARKQPNAWGFYDMTGNVWEWVEDCANANNIGVPSDGSAWVTENCKPRILRGGSWYSVTDFGRLAFFSTVRSYYAGFRLARVRP